MELSMFIELPYTNNTYTTSRYLLVIHSRACRERDL